LDDQVSLFVHLVPRLKALFDQPIEVQERKGYAHTLREICQQPATWLVTARDIVHYRSRLAALFADAGVGDRRGTVVLTGSGSSLYAAACVGPALRAALQVPVDVVAGGDLLTHPRSAFPPTGPSVMVSFARSGNSPESSAVVEWLTAHKPDCRHLALTCCCSGQLATICALDPRGLVVVLDDRTCDQSLVMTSSFTNMVVAARFLGLLTDPSGYQAVVQSLSHAAESLLARYGQALVAIAEGSFKSAVFLGSGCRHGGAREASLKLMEMSNGRVMSFAETYLGLRHGPMTAIHEDTLVVCFLSSDPIVRAYEVDLVRELNRKRLGSRKVLVGEAVPDDLALNGDLVVDCPGMAALGDDNLPVLDVLVAQLLAFFHCLHLGLRPDSPSADGVINRVVEPFAIYRQT
jgi:tagatose-6-phosphate ketose/aldose isomerase